MGNSHDRNWGILSIVDIEGARGDVVQQLAEAIGDRKVARCVLDTVRRVVGQVGQDATSAARTSA